MKIKIERKHHASTRVSITGLGKDRDASFARVNTLLREASAEIMVKDSQFHYTVMHRETDGEPWIEVELHSKFFHLDDATAAIRKHVHGHLVRKGHDVELKVPEVDAGPLEDKT